MCMLLSILGILVVFGVIGLIAGFTYEWEFEAIAPLIVILLLIGGLGFGVIGNLTVCTETYTAVEDFTIDKLSNGTIFIAYEDETLHLKDVRRINDIDSYTLYLEENFNHYGNTLSAWDKLVLRKD